MRKELALAIGTTLATLLLALLVLRWWMPQLFGGPVDLRLVASDERHVPYFQMILQQERIGTHGFSVPDPDTVLRGIPLVPPDGGTGPHDLLGFRNPGVPLAADIIALGDSQTYGLGTTMAETWPRRLQTLLAEGRAGDPEVYAMGLGGWALPQYLQMARHALRFHPRQVVMAVYVGNDPIETFMQVYGAERWASYRREGVDPGGIPAVRYPPLKEDQWRVNFPGDHGIHFTVDHRRINVHDHPSANEGWRLLTAMTADVAALLQEAGVDLLVTVIPTREYAYSAYVDALGIEAPASYQAMVAEEAARIATYAQAIAGMPGARYLDVAGPLLQGISAGVVAYPFGVDGHPTPAGQDLIARALAAAWPQAERSWPCGPIRWQLAENQWRHGIGDGHGRAWPVDLPHDEAPAISRSTAMRLDWTSKAPEGFSGCGG